MKKKVKTVDCTSTWTNLLPGFFDWIQYGPEFQRVQAKEGISKMAFLVDSKNAEFKEIRRKHGEK